ncbi:MAG TPA: hypothetical protein VKZ53_21885 [Candidatus Angelobacter sp.]|nr:hypothetical protein [Candidatus Angelobacter sp.]
MSTREVFHTIQNQLTIVMGKAELLASTSTDPRTQKGCADIETAVQTISVLLNRLKAPE